MTKPANLRNEVVVLLARRLRATDAPTDAAALSHVLDDVFKDLEHVHGAPISSAERTRILRTVDSKILVHPRGKEAKAWAAEVGAAAAVLGVDEKTLVRRLHGGLHAAVDAAVERKLVPGRAVTVKVCGMHDEASLLAALSAAKESGTDNIVIGMLLGITHASREKLSDEEGAALLRALRRLCYSLSQGAEAACVTHLVKAEELLAMIGRIEKKAREGAGGLEAAALQAAAKGASNGDLARLGRGFDIVQIHDAMPLADIEKVKAARPDLRLLKAVHVPKRGDVVDVDGLIAGAVALAKSPAVDGLLLDSASLSTNQIGGTGVVNDWQVARRVIDAVHQATGKSVALAGGLSPDNVRAAVEYTRADMVDANTGFRFDRDKSRWRSLDDSASSPKSMLDILTVLEQVKRS